MVIKTAKLGSLWNHGTTAAGRGRGDRVLKYIICSSPESQVPSQGNIISTTQGMTQEPASACPVSGSSSAFLEQPEGSNSTSQARPGPPQRLFLLASGLPELSMWLPFLPKGPSVHQAIALCLNCTTMQQCMEKLLCRAEGGSKNEHKKVCGMRNLLQKLVLPVL